MRYPVIKPRSWVGRCAGQPGAERRLPAQWPGDCRHAVGWVGTHFYQVVVNGGLPDPLVQAVALAAEDLGGRLIAAPPDANLQVAQIFEERFVYSVVNANSKSAPFRSVPRPIRGAGDGRPIPRAMVSSA